MKPTCMNKLHKQLLTAFLLLLIFISLPSLVHAQIDPSCDPQDPGCPIDGGLILLLAAGAGYGIKKMRNSQKKTASEL